MTDDATRHQIAAANPLHSIWLTANAGSGKTRVLTDRVARLLLSGTPPERILCLTYTKAAASEMQIRLLSRLGGWAMLPDAQLVAELEAMGADASGADLAEARRLFARAIETPGGLKVQTIHAFCAAILRRFPLEAGVPVGFAELDERSAAQLRADIIEEMAEEGAPEIADLVSLHSGHELDRFLAAVSRAEARLDTPLDPAELWGFAGLPYPFEPDHLLAAVMTPGDAQLLAELQPLLAASGPNDAKLAKALGTVDWDQPDLAALAVLEHQLLTGSGANEPFAAKVGKIPTKGLRDGACAHLVDRFDDLMRRVKGARPRRLALEFCQRTAALHRFAHAFTARYADAKRAQGWLDFDDLIARVGLLLSSASMAQWVLFRLDGGIDHILVDEAQDTSPEQWLVIERLIAEFTAGEGAREASGTTGRTLFVVGDPKQSIYSFQGADVQVFAERRARFTQDFAAIRRPMQQSALEYSFRSSPAVLALVDRVFEGDAGQGLGGTMRHRAFNTGQPGRVDLWPAVPKAEAPEALEWDDTAPQPEPQSAVVRLSAAIARQIEGMLGTPLRHRDGSVRPMVPGDVLILVQRRSEVFHDLIRALKAARLPVAGADRLKLAAELAVRDLRAVLSVLATPEDDLSLAAALRSPLFDVDEVGLWRLAAGRPASLWQALREAPDDLGPGIAAARALISDLIGVSGFMRPHDLLSRMLIRHGGRARLIARLGPEAEDGIDELLSQSLAYERSGVPTLTGFLVWLGEDEVEIKRSPASGGGGLIRVMTVHGAKGLESPVVILPDTAMRRKPSSGTVLPLAKRPAVLRLSKDSRPPVLAEAVAAHEARQAEESRRLLYVALTRAESWLIIAAAGETGADTDSWHAMVTNGFQATASGTEGNAGFACTELPEMVEGTGPVARLAFGDWPAEVTKQQQGDASDSRPEPAPDWLRRPPQATPAADRGPIAPTALGGAKIVFGSGTSDAQDAEAAMLAGTRLHLLLEHLPDFPPDDWPDRADALLASAEGGLPTPEARADLLAEVAAILSAPDLAAVFAPAPGDTVLREVDLSAPLPGLGTLSGKVDRLIVGPDRIVVIDYKSNVVVPDAAEATPPGILRQMAAYRAALRLIWPDRPVEAAVLWTRARLLVRLDDALLDRAMTGAVAALAAGGPVG
ncbi:double-strand break repair helicase AddA [Paracoccus suum]|uniref:DNA 3'-5' helicase n=1 Tax=Paracoccus suum TaxID=2259340 RepID=A0A344PHQ2_9RHOB|nr:double-strand break repair helicase AddA [Paracoccus suum]AXC48907.1 double-strand break repair helicase AddA [Paracoccus suum]